MATHVTPSHEPVVVATLEELRALSFEVTHAIVRPVIEDEDSPYYRFRGNVDHSAGGWVSEKASVSSDVYLSPQVIIGPWATVASSVIVGEIHLYGTSDRRSIVDRSKISGRHNFLGPCRIIEQEIPYVSGLMQDHAALTMPEEDVDPSLVVGTPPWHQ